MSTTDHTTHQHKIVFPATVCYPTVSDLLAGSSLDETITAFLATLDEEEQS